MTRLIFPYIVFMSLVAFASGVLNTRSRFAIPAFTPVLLNLAMIGASLFLVDYFETPIYALAAGVMIGGVAQLLVQWVALARLGVLPRYSARIGQAWSEPTVESILVSMFAAILGV